MSQMSGLDLQQVLSAIFRSKERASRFAELLAEQGYDLRLEELQLPYSGVVTYPEVIPNRKFQDNQFDSVRNLNLSEQQRRAERQKILDRANETALALNKFLYQNRPKPPQISEGLPEQEAFRELPLRPLYQEPVDEMERRRFDLWDAETFLRPEPFRLDI